MSDPVQIPMCADDADDAARIIADKVEESVHHYLVIWLEDGTLPDIGYLKLREMANTLAQSAVQPAFNTMMRLGHPEHCPVVNEGKRRKANV